MIIFTVYYIQKEEIFMKYLADTHMHSMYSYDGQMTLEDIVQKGVSLGLKYLCITEHLEFAQISLIQAINRYKIFENEINRLNELYPNIEILKGIEISNPNKYKDNVEKLQDLGLDYIIGSNHNLIPSIEYYQEILEIVKTGLIDTIGHLDYIRRKYNIECPLELLNEIFESMKKNNVILEVNSSAQRRINDLSFPNSTILDLYLNNYDNRITIGSDAHRVNEIYDGIPTIDERINANKGVFVNRKFLTIAQKK